MSSLLKLPFIAIVATSFHIIGDRPNPPVPKKERVENFWPGPIRGGSLYLTPVSTMGALAVTAGAFIRLRCYKALGSLFTFELTIRDDHKLVKHGPYSVVRHPSYSGGYLSAVGSLFWYFTPGSLLVYPTTWASRSFAIFFFILFLLGASVLWLRANEEDRLLRQRFGVEWEDWARKVPYKLVPYIY
ncbi:hypothetical protein M378DRAFT_187882 [Amanita muscaria Koide BX008]|uniref:Protein-S-isoprenylcysteine O-methyltransferase n=1 Tax=Amanita muscaria (strain Koide BX008) TaxID=946122 RepID=A0A0C2WEP8_AMAMK|nr:hypothetical protein M378DRAFT_187882 [Amanita muscaria Koide BX008]